MKDFVVYHNPDAMGYPANEHPSLTVLTNKRVSEDVIGDRVWLLTGEGTPRKYYLCAWFFIDQVESGDDAGFVTCLEGTNGNKFDPMIPIENEEWFRDFRKGQGNFAFGFQPINNQETVERLENLAKLQKV